MATQVEILMRTQGDAAKASAAEGSPDQAGKEGKDADNRSDAERGALASLGKTFSDKLGNAKKFFSKNLGLQFGLSSVLKQSQVFTSFVGTIFQLIGALVDVILAPLLPLFFPLIRLLAGAIPHAQKFGQMFAEKTLVFLQNLYNFGLGLLPFLDEKWKEFKTAWAGGWAEVAKLIWDWTFKGLAWVWDKVWTVGIPWVWDQIKGLGSSIWDALKGFLSSTAGRVFGWFVQASVMLGKLRGVTSFILRWAIKFGVGIIRFIGAKAIQLLVWGIKSLPKILGFGLKIVGTLLKTLLPGIGHIIAGVTRLGAYIVKGILNAAFSIVKFLFTWIYKGATLFVGKGKDAAKGLLKMLLEKVTNALSGMKFFGGAFKKLGESMKFLKVAAKASKAIPVLGAAATLGFGVAETISTTRKYGLKAGIATAGKTALATGLAGAGQTYASLAVDMGGSLAISQLAKRGAFGKEGTHFQPGGAGYKQEVVVKTTIVAQNGSTLQEEQTQRLEDGETATSNVTNIMQAAGGMPT